MKTFRNFVAGALVFSFLAPVAAFAETNTSSSIADILAKIKALQSQIVTLQTQQQQNVSALITTLKQGSEGDNVKTLQALLAADPSIYPEGIISGFFGRLTAEAVKRFQKKNGLEQVGNVGPKTLEKLKDFLGEHPLGFENATSTGERGEGKRPCAIVPPGHLIAPGWLRKNDGEKPVVPPCQTLPKGIEDREDRDEHGGTTTPPVVDTTAPVISNISITGLATTTATVNWATNENASSRVYYSQVSPVNLSTSANLFNNALVLNHSITITGLTGATTYYYVVESRDGFANTATSSTQSFVTSN